MRYEIVQPACARQFNVGMAEYSRDAFWQRPDCGVILECG
jgi:hypothetical protein